VAVLECKQIEDCLDGSSIYSYTLSAAWTRAAIRALGELGRLEYFADFPRPFFRVIGAEGLVIKGVEGETSCRVVYPVQCTAPSRRVVEAVLDSIQCG
jgi:hypothetical protein